MCVCVCRPAVRAEVSVDDMNLSPSCLCARSDKRKQRMIFVPTDGMEFHVFIYFVLLLKSR